MLFYRPFSTDRIILAVYTDNNLPRVEQKVSLGPSFDRLRVYITPLGTGPIFNLRLLYSACRQRNYYTS